MVHQKNGKRFIGTSVASVIDPDPHHRKETREKYIELDLRG